MSILVDERCTRIVISMPICYIMVLLHYLVKFVFLKPNLFVPRGTETVTLHNCYIPYSNLCVLKNIEKRIFACFNIASSDTTSTI